VPATAAAGEFQEGAHVRQRIRAADLFCGAGGTSTGLALAAQELGVDIDLLAINHWDVAIATHSANHPCARHLCERLDNVDPRKTVPGGRLHLLAASPECTHHSNARGGKPMSDQSRASAWHILWHILRWAEALYIDDILVENVREFESWGPLGVNGRPLERRRGETFLAFLNALESLGYKVEWRLLNAADYGDATTRERLFIQARRGNRRPTWPEGTHSRDGEITPFGEKQKWRAAREIIDWSIPSESIFHRRKPLAESTLRRIEAGLRKFGGRAAEPFIGT
jgi:DNA (cytosine-5)-methyltransferase 1